MTLVPVRRLNLDKYTPDSDDKWQNVSKLTPQNSAGVVVVGPPGSGKTNEVLSMILQPDYMHFDQIWIFAMDLLEGKYQLVKQMMEKRNLSTEESVSEDGRKVLPDFILTNDFSRVPAIEDIDKNKQTIVIFDDLVMESKKVQKPIVDFFKGARKRTCQMYYLTQGYFEVPSMVRRNAQYFWIYRLKDPREFKGLASTFELCVTKPVFHKIYIEATKPMKGPDDEKPYPGFLFVNTGMSYVPYRYRRGFGDVLAVVPMN